MSILNFSAFVVGLSAFKLKKKKNKRNSNKSRVRKTKEGVSSSHGLTRVATISKRGSGLMSRMGPVPMS